MLIPTMLLLSVVFAQDARFEVASVRASQPMDWRKPGKIGTKIDGARAEYHYETLPNLVAQAYNVRPFQVSAPDWMSADHWDIQATLPEGTSRDRVAEMLRALLAERFQLKTHFDSKEHAVYTLTIDKGGHQFKEFNPDGPKAVAPRPQMNSETTHMDFSKITMASLASLLSTMVDRPVVDQTGLTGAYELGMDFATKDLMGKPGGRGPGPTPVDGRPAESVADPGSSSIHATIKPLGLKLTPRKLALQQVVVDHAEKRPTDN